MLHGSLFDPFDEFFIEAKTLSVSDGNNKDNLSDNSGAGSNNNKYPIVSYEIKGDLLPAYIGSRVADKILFVGQAVTLFRCDEIEQKQRARMSKAAEELVAMAES